VPIEGDAEKIRLMLETMGIEGIDAAELAYDKLDKQIREVEVSSRGLQTQIQASKTATYDLVETEYQLVEAENAETQALASLLPARMGAADALRKSVVPAVDTGTSSLKKFGQGLLDSERAMTTLATGHGMMRLGGALERLTGAIGGPAGLGLAIAGMMNALEVVVPQFLKWINADNAKHAKDIADQVQRQADAADQLAQRPTKRETERKADIEEYITETQEGKLRMQIERAIRKAPGAMMTPEEFKEMQHLRLLAPGGEATTATRLGEMEREQEKRITEQVNKVFGGISTDRSRRLQAIELMETHPEEFKPGTAEALRRAQAGEKIGPHAVAEERDKAMQAERAALKEIATSSQKEQDRIKADILKRKADNATRQREWDQGMVQQGHELEQWEKADERERNDKIKADNDAKRFAAQKDAADKREAARQAREAARAGTLGGQREAEHKQVEAFVQNAGLTQDGMPASAGFKELIAHGAEENLAKGTAHTMADAVWQAIKKYNVNLEREFSRAMSGQAQQGAGMGEKVNGMQMWHPPGTSGY
jgi:hypothetical protein